MDVKTFNADEFLAQQTMLIIAPHADDECFGCAGTIARIKALGGKVYVVVASVGDLNHYNVGKGKTFVKGATRAEELGKVMSYLNVDDYDVLFTDAETHERMDFMPRRRLIELFERDGRLAIDKIQPTIVAIPAISYNQDHEAVFRAGFTACRPGIREAKHFAPIVLAYDNTALFWSLEREKFHPNFYVDITGYVETKVTALKMHHSQMKASLHHSSPENVRDTALVRGKEISVEAAEGYMALRFAL